MLARVHRWSRVTWRFTLRPRWDFHQSPWKDKNWRIGRNPSDVDVSVSGGNPGRWNLPTPPKTFLSDDLQDGRLLTHIRNTLVGPLNNQSSRCRTPIHLKLNQSTFIVIQRKIKVTRTFQLVDLMYGRRVSWPRNEPLTKRRDQSAAFVVCRQFHLSPGRQKLLSATWPVSRESAAHRSMQTSAPIWHFLGTKMRKHLDRAAVSLIKLMSNLFMNYWNNRRIRSTGTTLEKKPSGQRIRRIERKIGTQFPVVIS